MSAPVMFLFVIGVAAIVWSVCFVGCGFNPPPQQVADQFDYQSDVLNTTGLVALWPLNDTAQIDGAAIAVDLGPNHLTGVYNGAVTLNQPNIVAGDTVNEFQPEPANPCVKFDGGFVNVPWNAVLGSGQFTLEAWVVPNWSSTDTPAVRSVVASASAPPGTSAFTGFGLIATMENFWSASIGIGSTDIPATMGNNQTIVQGMLYFLVMTYDGTTLNLWVNPADTSQPPDATMPASGYVPPAQPVPLYIGAGRPDLPTPQFPFNGFIQDVAFYNVVLDGKTIQKHFASG